MNVKAASGLSSHEHAQSGSAGARPVIHLPLVAKLLPCPLQSGYLPAIDAPTQPAPVLPGWEPRQDMDAVQSTAAAIRASASYSVADLQSAISSACHWTELDVLLCSVTRLPATPTTPVDAHPQAQGTTSLTSDGSSNSSIRLLPLAVLEQLVLKHRELLHTVPVESAGIDSIARPIQHSWYACGQRLCKAMQAATAMYRSSPDTAPPASTGDTPMEGSVNALEACIKGQPDAAVNMLVSMAQLPQVAHCRRYTDKVVRWFCTSCLHTCTPTCLAALLSACHQLKYNLTRAQLSLLIQQYNQHVHHMDSSQLAASIAALLGVSTVLKVPGMSGAVNLALSSGSVTQHTGVNTRQTHGYGSHQAVADDVQQTQEDAADVQQKQQDAAEGDAYQEGSSTQTHHQLWNELQHSLQTALHRLRSSLAFHGLAPAELAVLLDQLDKSGVAVPAQWMDAATMAVMRTHKAHIRAMQPEQPLFRQASADALPPPSPPALGQDSRQSTDVFASAVGDHVQGVSHLLDVLARLHYQPSAAVTRWLINTIQAALPAPVSVPHLLPHLMQGSLPPRAAWSTDSSAQVANTPAGGQDCVWLTPEQIATCASRFVQLKVSPGGHWCAAALAGLLNGPSGGGSTHGGQLLGLLPELLGPSQHVREVWVRHQLPALELLISQLSDYLASASAGDLTAIATGCAAIRFHAGEQFWSWHAAACQKKIKSFRPQALVQIRGAYSALGFRPETRFAQMLHTAVQHVLRSRQLQGRRAEAAVEVALEAMPLAAPPPVTSPLPTVAQQEELDVLQNDVDASGYGEADAVEAHPAQPEHVSGKTQDMQTRGNARHRGRSHRQQTAKSRHTVGRQKHEERARPPAGRRVDRGYGVNEQTDAFRRELGSLN